MRKPRTRGEELYEDLEKRHSPKKEKKTYSKISKKGNSRRRKSPGRVRSPEKS